MYRESRMHGRTILKRLLIIFGLAAVLGYSAITILGFVQGPRIVLMAPPDGFSTTTPAIQIAGHVIHASTLTINDAPLSLDLQGNFSTQLLLARGYNIITVEAKDRYGRMTAEQKEIILTTE